MEYPVPNVATVLVNSFLFFPQIFNNLAVSDCKTCVTFQNQTEVYHYSVN